MQQEGKPSVGECKAERLARLAKMLELDISPESLAALANQLSRLEALEDAELQNHPPSLKLVAGWHD